MRPAHPSGSGATSLAAHGNELARRRHGSVAPGEQIDGKRQPVVVADKSITRLTLLVPTTMQHLQEAGPAMTVGCTRRASLDAVRVAVLPPRDGRILPPWSAAAAAGGGRRPLK